LFGGFPIFKVSFRRELQNSEARTEFGPVIHRGDAEERRTRVPESPLVDDVEPGALTPLSIKVKPPATTHEVSLKQLERWITRTPKSPRETAQKSRVPELLQQMG
jgi:hypothetical protein